MLTRDIKKVLNESCFNPKKELKILQDVGNPDYWITKATEELLQIKSLNLKPGSKLYHAKIKESIKLLALTRAYLNEQETRDNTSKED